jgi:hypothetical protein
VQKGVFSNYDNTITVGKAIENNSILKGGKWKAIEMEGRDYVTYTVRMTGNQVRALLPESLSSTESYRNKPHYGTAVSFYYNLSFWRRYNGYERTSMSAEEIEQAYDIFKAVLEAYEEGPKFDDFFNPSGVIDRPEKIHDDFLDPYLRTIRDQIDSDPDFYWDSNEGIYKVVTYGISSSNPLLEIENGMFTANLKSAVFDGWFGNTKYANNTNFINALVRTRTKYYDRYVKAFADYRNAYTEWQERSKNDIEPLLTIDGYEIILSFVMNQDDTFTTNMMESYAEVTLNCFDNLKVRYNVGNIKNDQSILNYIYRGFTPAFLWQR